MIAKAKVTLGRVDYEFTVDEKDEKETLNKIITLSNPRNKCNVCECLDRDKFYLTTNKDSEGNVYVSVKCGACGAKSNLGSYKTGGFFWKDFEQYTPKKSDAV